MVEIVAPQAESVKARGQTAEVGRDILQADPVQVNQLQLLGPRQVGKGVGHSRSTEEPGVKYVR